MSSCSAVLSGTHWPELVKRGYDFDGLTHILTGWLFSVTHVKDSYVYRSIYVMGEGRGCVPLCLLKLDRTAPACVQNGRLYW
jgi:hypothetical protein